MYFLLYFRDAYERNDWIWPCNNASDYSFYIFATIDFSDILAIVVKANFIRFEIYYLIFGSNNNYEKSFTYRYRVLSQYNVYYSKIEI